MDNVKKGRTGEDLVLQKYLDEGYNLIAQNFEFYSTGHQGRIGEIDLIFIKDEMIFMVEVKSRENLKYGNIVEQVTRSKLYNLFRAYQYFLVKNPQFKNLNCQFDLAAVFKGDIKIYPNAYNFDGMY